jgi:hypothetical protein
MADGLLIILQEYYCLHYHSVHNNTDMNYPGIDLNLKREKLGY